MTIFIEKFVFLVNFLTLSIMTAKIFVTLLIALLLVRIFIAHKRSSDLNNREFKSLPRGAQLAVLKERMLQSPSEKNLDNLSRFLKQEGISADTETYRPLFAEQLRISREENAIALDNALFTKEAAWMDAIEPFEFEEANAQKAAGNQEEFVKTYLYGILRYYSDEKIEAALLNIIPEYPNAQKILDDYQKLKELRDSSGADDKSIEKLYHAKATWRSQLDI